MFFLRVPADEEIIKVHCKIIHRNKWMAVLYVSFAIISILMLLSWGIMLEGFLGVLGELGLDEKDKNLISIGFGLGTISAFTILCMASCIPLVVQSLRGNPESKLLLKYHDRLAELGDIEDVAEQDGLGSCGLR